MNLIAVDIGNSSINIGYFTESELIVQKIETLPLRAHSEYCELIERFRGEKNIDKKTEGCIISSVVPGYTEVLRRALKELTSVEPLLVSCKMKTGLAFRIPKPDELGTDRIADAVAAYELYKGPVAVVDCGTATTISVVGKDADYIGGSIMPGIGLMNNSLAKGTAKLSKVMLSPPESALGIDTEGCIQSGIFFGTAGATERLLSEMEKETGFALKVVVSGGYGSMISRFLRRAHILKPHLTIEGLKIIYLRNRDA